MTVQEVIEYLEQHGFIADEVKDMCIEALVQVEQYRALGTVEEGFKPKTNADRIRNFSDEELAEWLHNICQFESSEHFPMISIYNLDTKCEEEIGDNYKDLIEWLQAEVEEGKADECN